MIKIGTPVKVFLIIVAIIILSVYLTLPIHKILYPLFKFKFEQVLNRLIEIFIIAVVVYYMRGKKIRWRDYGFDFSVAWKKLFTCGFVAGALTVAFIATIEVLCGPGYLRHPLMLQDVIERFFKGALSGIAVGIVEEFLFRGFVFNSLERKIKTVWAVILTSAIYSSVHFLDNGQIFVPSNPTVGDSIRLLVGYLEPFTHRPLVILPEFLGLFFFGLLLNVAFVRTRTLFVSIGIHAGAVFFIKFQHSFFRKGPNDFNFFYGRNPVYDGLFEWAVLLLLCALVYFYAPKISKKG